MLLDTVLLADIFVHTSSTASLEVGGARHGVPSNSATVAARKAVKGKSAYQNNEGHRPNETPYEIVINVKPATIGERRINAVSTFPGSSH